MQFCFYIYWVSSLCHLGRHTLQLLSKAGAQPRSATQSLKCVHTGLRRCYVYVQLSMHACELRVNPFLQLPTTSAETHASRRAEQRDFYSNRRRRTGLKHQLANGDAGLEYGRTSLLLTTQGSTSLLMTTKDSTVHATLISTWQAYDC